MTLFQTIELKTSEERAVWFDGYVRTYLGRDLQDLSSSRAPVHEELHFVTSIASNPGRLPHEHTRCTHERLAVLNLDSP